MHIIDGYNDGGNYVMLEVMLMDPTCRGTVTSYLPTSTMMVMAKSTLKTSGQL